MSESSAPARLFIGSSSEGLEVAHNLQAVLEQRAVCEVEVWDQDVFAPSSYAIEALVGIAARIDFAVLIASADDVTSSRGVEAASVRDNVIFEHGLFVGALGRERTYLLSTGDHNLKLPSDVLGLMRLPYRARSDNNLRAAVNDAALQVARQVKQLGLRERPTIGTGNPGSRQSALDHELALLCANAMAQGWTVKTNSPTTLRLCSPRGKNVTMDKGRPDATRVEIRRFAPKLRAAGLRVNRSLRRPVEESPFS